MHVKYALQIPEYGLIPKYTPNIYNYLIDFISLPAGTYTHFIPQLWGTKANRFHAVYSGQRLRRIKIYKTDYCTVSLISQQLWATTPTLIPTTHKTALLRAL